jgi:hypothetical protein
MMIFKGLEWECRRDSLNYRAEAIETGKKAEGQELILDGLQKTKHFHKTKSI